MRLRAPQALTPSSHTGPTVLRVRTLLVALVCASLLASASAGSAPAAKSADAAVFGGLGTWVDIYDGGVYAAPERTAQRMAARRVRRYGSRRRTTARRSTSSTPFGSGASSTPCTHEGSGPSRGTSPGTSSRRSTPAARSRCSRSGRRAAVQFDGVALNIESTRLRNVALRSRRAVALTRAASRGGGRRSARDRPLQPARARAAAVDLAGLPVGRARRERRRVRADGLHGWRVDGIRRDIRLRDARAPAPASPRWPGRSDPRRRRRREPSRIRGARGLRRGGRRRRRRRSA